MEKQFFDAEQATYNEGGPVESIAEKLSMLVGETLVVEDVDGTYEIDCDAFYLTFVLDDEQLEIRNIDTHGNNGLGSKIISVLHEYSDEQGIAIVASNVRAEAQEFWRKMGYEEGSNHNEFYRAA